MYNRYVVISPPSFRHCGILAIPIYYIIIIIIVVVFIVIIIISIIMILIFQVVVVITRVPNISPAYNIRALQHTISRDPLPGDIWFYALILLYLHIINICSRDITQWYLLNTHNIHTHTHTPSCIFDVKLERSKERYLYDRSSYIIIYYIYATRA